MSIGHVWALMCHHHKLGSSAPCVTSAFNAGINRSSSRRGLQRSCGVEIYLGRFEGFHPHRVQSWY